MLEFQNGRSRRYRVSKGGPPHPLGQKQKLKALSLKKFLKLFRFSTPKPTKHDTALPDGTRFETAPKTGCNWNDGTSEPMPSSGSEG